MSFEFAAANSVFVVLFWSCIMKTFIVMCLVCSVGVIALARPVSQSDAIIGAITRFMESGDKQKPALAESVLHKDFALFYMGPDGLVKTDKEAYKSALEARKIGGMPRTVSVSDIRVKDEIASAKAIFRGNHADFTQFVSLMKFGAQWKIMNIVLKFEPKK